jgi:hypothetical protein
MNWDEGRYLQREPAIPWKLRLGAFWQCRFITLSKRFNAMLLGCFYRN